MATISKRNFLLSFHVEYCDSLILHRNKYWHFFYLGIVCEEKSTEIEKIFAFYSVYVFRFIWSFVGISTLLTRIFGLYVTIVCRLFFIIYFCIKRLTNSIQFFFTHFDGMRFIKAIILLLETDSKMLVESVYLVTGAFYHYPE